MQDNINHPHYYKGKRFECLEIIEDFSLDFCLGNALKYILRAGKKTSDVKQDLEKAIWYIKRKIGK